MATNLLSQTFMKQFLTVVALCLSLVLNGRAQNDSLPPPQPYLPSAATQLPQVQRTTLLGVGSRSQYDSYLSPLRYSGIALSLLWCSTQPRPFQLRQWQGQTMGEIQLAQSNYPKSSATFYDATLRYTYALRYQFTQPSSPLQWGVGGSLDAEIGGIYNTANGNNPGQGRAAIALGLSTALDYRFSLLRLPFIWHTQCEVPLIGAAFSPRFGQPYYDLFYLQHYDHNVVLSHPVNTPSLRLLSTLSLPIGRTTRLTLGYRADIRQSNYHALKSHSWTHQFVVGFTRTLQFLPE